MRAISILYLILLLGVQLTAQDLPYRQIPDYPETYTAGTMTARMVDGLGFRFYWATEGIQPETMAFQTTEGARTVEETVSHIYNLTLLLLRTVDPEAGERAAALKPDTFDAWRSQTLKNLAEASAILSESSPEALNSYIIVLGSGERQRTLPFWNHVNGPIADAIWHCGQIATLRRAAGDPISGNVSFLMGTVQE